MLTIEYKDIIEAVRFDELFSVLGVDSHPVQDDGETCVENQFAIEVKSLDTFYPIEAFRMTAQEETVIVTLESGHQLEASPDHVVLVQNPADWKKLKDLSVDSVLVTPSGPSKIVSLDKSGNLPQRLYDLQVSISHSYYTNDIMSHNSHFLVALGANALKNGLNVLHYTFELSEEKTAIRYDSHLCEIDSSDVIENKEKVMNFYRASDELGRLKVKHFPPNTATIFTLRSHIEKLALKGFRPDVVLIDYADIMRSTRQYESLRHELKLIYEELRGYADELKIPFWTASQSNKEGSESEVIDLSNMSESYGKAFVADVVVSLSRRAQEKATGFGRLFIAKNRAGKDGILWPIKINTARSTFEIIGETLSPEIVVLENESDMKKALSQKWKQLQQTNTELSLSKINGAAL